MSPKPIINEFNPKWQFVGRTDLIDKFQQQLTTPLQNNRFYVQHFYGAGGHGKSELLSEYIRQLDQCNKKDPIPMRANAKLDFQDKDQRKVVRALVYLRLGLSQGKAGVKHFFCFDAVFARYFSEQYLGLKLDSEFPDLAAKEYPMLIETLEQLENDVGLNLPFQTVVLKGIAKLWNKMKLSDWWLENIQQALAMFPDNSDQRVTEQHLIEALGKDLRLWLAEPDVVPPRKVFIFYDTHEALWEDTSVAIDSIRDKWIRQLIEQTQGVVHTLAGREKLTWEVDEPHNSWDVCLQQKKQIPLNLRRLKIG